VRVHRHRVHSEAVTVTTISEPTFITVWLKPVTNKPYRIRSFVNNLILTSIVCLQGSLHQFDRHCSISFSRYFCCFQFELLLDFTFWKFQCLSRNFMCLNYLAMFELSWNWSDGNVDIVIVFSYGLDVNVDRAEDVLLHRSLLDLARDPDKRPVYHIRLLEVFLLNHF